MQLRHQLQNTRKGSLKMSDYILKMKGISDNLAAAGSPMTEQDLVMSILSGVGNEFDSVVVHLTAQEDSVTINEKRFQRGSYGRGNNRNGRGRGGKGRGFICQLCGKNGHLVSSCFKRFDQNFQGLVQNSQSPQQTQSTQSQNPGAQFSQFSNTVT
ncbi:hypothetical protein ACOSQ2_022182 [Xanthoceras sorbifolium]